MADPRARPVINLTRIAGRLPLHASSSGLVPLAHAARDLQETVLAERLTVFTANTIVDPRRLRTILADVRKTGYVLCPGFIDEQATGIAVPVRGARGEVIAALSVIVPNDAHARTRVPVLQAAARDVARAISDTHG